MQTPNVTTAVSDEPVSSVSQAKLGLGRRVGLVLAALVVTSLIYVPFAEVGGSGLRAIFIGLAAFAGWQLGFRRGTVAAIAILPIILVLSAVAGVDIVTLVSPGSMVGSAVLVCAGATAGFLHEMDSARSSAESAMRAERDHAKQKQIEADRANAQMRAVLDASAEAMILVDARRQILLVNRSFEAMFGIDPAQVVGGYWRDMGALVARIFAEPEEFARLVAGTASDPEVRFAADVRQRWPTERQLELSTMPVAPSAVPPLESGVGPIGRLYVLRDVTDEREVARLREERRRMLEADLERAAQIQADLLPIGKPQAPVLDFAARCLPAYAVGGDFFDWHEPCPGVLTLTLGDVMGKGLSAALLMATVRAALEAVSSQNSPARALEAVASATSRDLERAGAFVTLFHARVESGCHLEYADAGHGYAFVRRLSGAVEPLPERGLPLGIFPTQHYPQGAVDLAPGDALVIYSDGLVDACPDPAVIASHLQGAPDASAMVDRLVALATDGPPRSDDLTIVVLRRREEPQVNVR